LIAGCAAWPTMARAVPRPPGAPRRLRLVNAHTGETFEGSYRNDKGPIDRVIDELCVFLRDHHSGEKTQIDVGVIDFLADVLDAVGETRATILSAYRTAETNAMLARTTFGVAEHSQHIVGRALDLHLGSKLTEAMTTARAMQRGGVGWYPAFRLHSYRYRASAELDPLDARGLDSLLVFDGRRLKIDGQGQVVLGGPWQPLTVPQRLVLQRQLARAEFLARSTGNLRIRP